MAFTSQVPTAAASGTGGSGGSSGTDNNTSAPPPYYIPASEFPLPANITVSGLVTQVAVTPLPGAVAAYAVAYGTTNASGSVLWFNQVSYSASDAYAIAKNGSCGPVCGQLPLSWGTAINVSAFGPPIAATRVVSAGPELVLAVSSGGTTYLFSAGPPYSNWTTLGSTIPGTLGGITADPEDVAIATVVSGAVYATLVSAAGSTVGQAEILPAGSSATGVVGAGIALTTYGATYLESVAFTVSGLDEVQFASSTNGASFSSPAVIGAFSVATASSTISPAGETALSWTGGIPGQLALTSVDSDLFLLCTTNQSGQTVPATEVSGNNGTNWSGPYVTSPLNGSIVNPAISVGPTGMVYATWEEPDYGTGATDEATYAADGLPVAPPQTIVASSGNGSSPATPTTIAVDGFGRPLLLWGIGPANGTTGAVAYTGGYLTPSTALNATEASVGTTLASPDFAGTESPPLVSSFLANVSGLVAQAEANLSAGNVCNAQNATARYLYQNLSHVTLATAPGIGCPTVPASNPSNSPLKMTSGAESPNTFYAVYVDWALEAEGVAVTSSPLSAVTEVYPYTALALSAGLPPPVTASETVSSKTASVTVTPTAYSPTAYELAVSDSLPSWMYGGGYKCFYPNGGWSGATSYEVTSVSATSTNVSINGGPVHKFTGTTAYPSVWVYDLPADQVISWTATVYATTTEIHYWNDPCAGLDTIQQTQITPASPATIPAMTVSGTFPTSLSVTYGAGLITAKLNTNRTTAQISVLFNNTLPATVVSTLSNATGTQNWSSSALSVPESYSFAAYSAVGPTYTFSEMSTSRSGTSSSPGSPSFAYGSSGTGAAESAGLWCRFTLSSAGPKVWTNNSTAGTWPYSNINATTVDVTWYSNEDVTGFYSYYEVGSSITRTITGILPVRVAPGNWSYSIEVYGLESLAAYGGAYGVSWTNGCLVEEDQLSGQVPHVPSDPGFSTADPLAVTEADQSFDSVAGIGGGITLTWPTPKVDLNLGIQSGYVTIQNLTNPSWKELIPVSASEVTNGTIGKKTVRLLSLDSSLAPGTKYKATLALNYTGQTKPQYGSTSFTYHQDSSGDGLTDNEKTAGWNVSYAPSGTVVISKNRVLNANLIASNVIIDAGVTLTTNGFNIIAANEFFNYGTIDTGTVPYVIPSVQPPYSEATGVPSLPHSYGGSGGGAYVVYSEGNLCCGNGGSTLSAGGSAATSSGHNAYPGSTPGAPSHLSSQVIGAWWNSSMSSYLSGEAGGLVAWGVAGQAGRGLYIQADQLVAGRIDSAGAAGAPYGGSCSGQTAFGGGGGGGSILLAYLSPQDGGSYTAPPSGEWNVSGGPAGGCPGDGSSGRGGNGQLITYPFTTPPVPPPAPPTFAGSTMVVKHVHAAVSERVGKKVVPVFSTNGLDNDYLEKAYGLNPNTVDTAGSDMLDLWNLTFDLGPVPVTQPTSMSGIVAWSEVNTSTWDPWGPPGSPSNWGTNITCTAASCPANSSSVSSLLWPTSQLQVFLHLPGVEYDLRQGNYLRGVVGTCPATAKSYCGTDRILTLWGKLSWGANPLAGSTPGNGIPDGARVNPVGGTDLQVTVTQWSVTNSSSNFRTGSGVAAYINAASSGTPEYGNFTNQTNVTWGWIWIVGSNGFPELVDTGYTSFAGAFTVTFPVDPTQQYAQLNLSLVQNTGVNGGNSYQTPLRTPVYQVDLENPSAQPNVTFWQNSSSGCYMLQFHWQVLPVQAKAPTWIYIPVGNATLSALPQGLQRYTGEQNFIELVLNDTAPMGFSPSVSGLPYSNNTSSGGVYTFGLAPGLNNILVPRSVFLSTPLGRSVLNISGSSTPDVSISQTNSDAFLQTQWAGPSEQNGALWFDRVTGADGYTKGSAGYIEVAASTSTVNSTNPSLTGGVPANPSLEQGYTSLAIQAIYAANESAATEVEGLLAGLLLNTTGNFTGWLLNATAELPTLGLLPSVMDGMANATYVNDGGYGAPVSTATQQVSSPPWWDLSADWNWFWNSVSGVITGVVSLVWNAAIAAAAFMGDLVKAEVRFAFNLASQAQSALEKVGAIIASAFNTFLEWVINHVVKPLITAAFSPISTGTTTWADNSNSTVQLAQATLQAGAKNITKTEANSIWSSLDPVFEVAQAIAVAAIVAIGVLIALTFGAANLVQNVVLGLIVSVVVYAVLPVLIVDITAALIYQLEGWGNRSQNQGFQQFTWTSFVDAVSFYDAGVTTTTAAMALWSSWFNPFAMVAWLDITAFAFALVGFLIEAVAVAQHSKVLAVEGIVFGGISVVLDLVAVATDKTGWKRALDLTSLGLDGAAFGLGATEL
jgi:hypothetical protein